MLMLNGKRFGPLHSMSWNLFSRYFNRDVECIRRFFKRRFRYESSLYPRFTSSAAASDDPEKPNFKLDVVVAASGFSNKEMHALEEVRTSQISARAPSNDVLTLSSIWTW